MNEEYTPFEEWFETYERDGGELMLYNTIDLEAAFLAGAAAMREKCAEVAEAMSMRAMEHADNMVAGKHPMQIPDYKERTLYRRVAAAIRNIEVE